MEPAYTISSPGAFGSGELKIPQDIKTTIIIKKKLGIKSSAEQKNFGEEQIWEETLGTKFFLEE